MAQDSKMWDEVKGGNAEMLRSVLGRYKNKKMGYQAVNRYACGLEFVPDCYKIQKMGNKAVSNYPSAIQFIIKC